jgi:hypothetical protein
MITTFYANLRNPTHVLHMLRMITLISACYTIHTQGLRKDYAMTMHRLRNNFAYSTIVYALLRNHTHVTQEHQIHQPIELAYCKSPD